MVWIFSKLQVCIVILKRERQRDRERCGRQPVTVSCILPSAMVGAALLDLLEGQTDLVKGSGAPVLLPLFTPRSRGT